MKNLIKFLISLGITAVLIVFFYVFYPHIWGEFIYPLEYKDIVSKYSKERNLDPNFVCAVIYTESHFNYDSVSGAGATGLMQLMPATAKGISERLGEASMGDLFDPEVNIRYGTQYLIEKFDEYGDIDVVLASYNAGGGRAMAWKLYGEALPNETVGFIAKVKNTKDLYDKVYGPWWAQPEVRRPNPFYQGILNFQDFVKGLLIEG